MTAGDIGAKFGRNGLDNGWIQFSHVRIPRTNMLSKWVNVDKSGKFHPAPNPAIMYATLIPERLSIMGGTWVLAGQAVTIAARYGVVRRQGAENQKIMDYQSHYTKLMPCVAFMYVSNITNRWVPFSSFFFLALYILSSSVFSYPGSFAHIQSHF